MKGRIKTLLLAGVLSPALVLAQGDRRDENESIDAVAARELLTSYLTAVKAKKWQEAKRLIHPETVKAIAERKKRLGREDHPMAPWYLEKVDYYLKEFKVTDVREAFSGTFVVETSEDNFQVEEKGIAEGEMASYLVGKRDGKWYIVDKKRLETFTNDSIKLGYKGYFDKEKAKVEEK
jgi:hypothetical protein